MSDLIRFDSHTIVEFKTRNGEIYCYSMSEIMDFLIPLLERQRGNPKYTARDITDVMAAIHREVMKRES